MKLKALVFLSLVVVMLTYSATSCAAFQKSFNNLTYSAVSMTSSDEVLVAGRLFKRVINNRRSAERQLKTAELLLISRLVEDLDLTLINDLDVPSKRHRFDGAMLALVKVQIGEKIYESVPFDHNNPPEQLRPLVDYLISISP